MYDIVCMIKNLRKGIPKTSFPKMNFGYLQGQHPDMSCLVENNYDPTIVPTTQPSTPPSTTLAPTPKVSMAPKSYMNGWYNYPKCVHMSFN